MTPRLAAYADDSADARSVAYTEILSVYAIVYGTDNILVGVDAVRREFVAERSWFFLLQIRRSLELCCLYNFVKHI